MTTKTDVLIIGGGSIGLNCAYYQSRHDMSHTQLG
ncbi:MAG: FAD-binding oxidoreductase [Anaerolineales bacterium]|nr:FAD-binding oxidoreductase [Anaerolineales bacterium]